MSAMKRSFGSIESVEEIFKKLRTTTRFESLSNELYYEIFDYLDGCNIHRAFVDLNRRFQNLLNHSNLPLKIHFSSKSHSSVENACRYVILPNKHRLVSLRTDSDRSINAFFLHCNLNESFNCLESITLNNLVDYRLTTFLFFIKTLPRLSSLTLQIKENFHSDINDVFRLIFQFSSLRYFKLSLSAYEEIEISIPMPINVVSSPIRRLILNYPCDMNELISILQYVPHLSYLSCEHLTEKEEITRKEMSLRLPHLKHVSFTEISVDFNLFEMFIKNLSPQLQVLRLTSSNLSSYLNPGRWKNLIQNHLPHLDQFHLTCSLNLQDDEENITVNGELIKEFTSPFWIERQWFFELRSNYGEFEYSIHPYKKKWSDEQATFCLDQHINFLPPIGLHLLDALYFADFDIIETMKPYFQAASFTHLSIDCKSISVDNLVEIVRLLPNLHSLEVSRVPVTERDYLSSEDTVMLLLVSIVNKITKVKLNLFEQMEQLSILMNLCPRVQYLEVHNPTLQAVQDVLGYISMNNTTCIPYLKCLGLSGKTVAKISTENLHCVMNYERLFDRPNVVFRDYTTRRVGEKILLHWKL